MSQAFDLQAWLLDPARRAHERERNAEHVERRAEEEREAAAACARGDCVYACPKCKPLNLRNPRRHATGDEHDHVCAGYATTKYLEHGQPLVRSRVCERRMAWARVEAEKARRKRDEEARKAKGQATPTPPREWGSE